MAKKSTDSEAVNSFEKSMQSLESLVEALENDELPLEKALEAFESGIKIARQAQKTLAEAEQKVYQLSEEHGEVNIEALDDGEENA